MRRPARAMTGLSMGTAVTLARRQQSRHVGLVIAQGLLARQGHLASGHIQQWTTSVISLDGARVGFGTTSPRFGALDRSDASVATVRIGNRALWSLAEIAVVNITRPARLLLVLCALGATFGSANASDCLSWHRVADDFAFRNDCKDRQITVKLCFVNNDCPAPVGLSARITLRPGQEIIGLRANCQFQAFVCESAGAGRDASCHFPECKK
jgi:hypothetical protein